MDAAVVGAIKPKIMQLHLTDGNTKDEQGVDANTPGRIGRVGGVCGGVWHDLIVLRQKAVAHLALLALMPSGHEIEMPDKATNCFTLTLEPRAIVKCSKRLLPCCVEVARVYSHASIFIKCQPLVRICGCARNPRTRRRSE